MTPAKGLDRAHGIVAEVLVIDRVEFQLGDEIAHIRRLDHGYAVRLEQPLDAARESVGIGNMREDVVGVDDVGELAFRGEPPGKLLVEELNQRRDALGLDRELRDVGRGLDAENRDAALLVELQQISIVARDLDHEACRPETAAADQRLDQRARMLDHRIGKRGGIGVVAEQPLGRHRFADLHQRALRTEIELEREAVLRLVQLLGGQQRIGERHPSEVEHLPEVRLTAGSTPQARDGSPPTGLTSASRAAFPPATAAQAPACRAACPCTARNPRAYSRQAVRRW